MFGSSFMSSLPSTGSSSAPNGAGDSGNKNNSNATTTPLPFAGFGSSFTSGGGATTASSSKSAVKALSFTSGLSNAAASSSSSAGKKTGAGGGNNTSGGAATAVPSFNTTAAKVEPAKKTLFSSATASSTTTASTTDIVPINDNTSPPHNNNMSLENTCLSPDGRSFHTYMYDSTIGKHVIISEFAPFISPSNDNTWENDNNNNGTSSSSAKKVQIKTILPTTVSEAISIDPVLGLICVEGDNGNNSNNNSGSSSAKKSGRRMKNYNGQGKELMALPWMCLYTCSSAFLLSIGYVDNEEEEDDDDATNNSGVVIDGEIIRIMEPFEKELLMSSRGSAILRIRSAPISGMFHRCGSMTLLMREGGEDDSIGHVMLLYHGLPESLLSGGGGGSRTMNDVDKKYNNSSSEGCVTTPLRFDHEDLVRGMEDTLDAENEAYNSSSLRSTGRNGASTPNKTVTDFCFLSQETSTSISGASKAFASMSILVLCADGSVYSASPIIFDGMVMPRSVVVDAILHLNTEIEDSGSYVASLPLSPVTSTEQEQVEARMRQCKAAKKYLLDAFGISDGPSIQGSYYVSASIVHPRSSYTSSTSSVGSNFSEALAHWQPRLQGPLVIVPQSEGSDNNTDESSSCVCIEPFGRIAGAGIVDGFVVAQSCGRALNVNFGIIPGEGSVVLPRFEFESDGDCQLIDDLLRGTGAYVERTSIKDDQEDADTAVRDTGSVAKRNCAIVIDPLDDIMVHISTKSRIATVSTNAVAVAAHRIMSHMDEGSTNSGNEMTSVRTKVWSALETTNNTAILGAGVSNDVHLGHILLARLSSGPVEVINVTATQYLHESSELMKAKTEQLSASDGDDAALQVLKTVKPLHELLQPLVSDVSNGLSKMGKIVGGSTLPKDAGPEILSIFLETQRSCEVNVVTPIEQMSKILHSRRDLLKEMHAHQAAELERLTKLLDEFKEKHESNVKRVKELEANASKLAERSSAVLTASRSLHPHLTDAEAAYFKDLKRYESTCKKWDEKVSQLKKDATSSCDAMSAGAIQNGEVRCLVDLPSGKIDICHKMLRGEAQLLKTLEQKVKDSSDIVEKISKSLSKGEAADSARLRLVGSDKENQT